MVAVERTLRREEDERGIFALGEDAELTWPLALLAVVSGVNCNASATVVAAPSVELDTMLLIGADSTLTLTLRGRLMVVVCSDADADADVDADADPMSLTFSLPLPVTGIFAEAFRPDAAAVTLAISSTDEAG